MSYNTGPNVGDLSRRINILRAATAKDAVGQKIETFTTLVTVWANYTPVSDAEKVRANEVYASLSGRFIIRYSTAVANIDAKDRIGFDGRVFDIIGVKETERHRWLEITAATRSERS